MNPELIETPTEALIFIVIELIMLTVTFSTFNLSLFKRLSYYHKNRITSNNYK